MLTLGVILYILYYTLMFFSSFPNLPLLFLPSDLSSLPLLIYLLFCSPLPIFWSILPNLLYPSSSSFISHSHSLPSQTIIPLPSSLPFITLLFSSIHLPLFFQSSLPFLPFPIYPIPILIIQSIRVGIWISLFIFNPHQQFDPACFIGVDGWGV